MTGSQENRILLEKMERYAAYHGAQHLRPWSSRGSLNFKNGMVYSNGGLQIDHMNIPVNSGTVSGGTRKSDYRKRQACCILPYVGDHHFNSYHRTSTQTPSMLTKHACSLQELKHLAKENLKIIRSIEMRKPVYSAQQFEHEYLENVSRIDRLSSFRGPAKAAHRPSAVSASLEVAKSMRNTKWLPGTDGYQRDLAKSMTRSYTPRCVSADAALSAIALVLLSVDHVR
jgi:hypothetical protein